MERQDAIDIFLSAVESVHPSKLIGEYLSVHLDMLTIGEHKIPLPSFENLYVIGAGKASAAMAVEVEKIIGKYVTAGLVVTRYSHSLPTSKIEVIEAAHPIPDERGIDAVKKTLQLLQQVRQDDIVLCLLSGGASALWCDLPDGISFPEVQTLFNLLINSGATIDEMNTVRKHLSKIKGGQLINHCNGARVFTLMISDVPSDSMHVIASGPTAGDLSTFQEAYQILQQYQLLEDISPSIRSYIEKGMRGMSPETPRQDDPMFNRTVNQIIGNNRKALLSAAAKAKSLGYHIHFMEHIINGDVSIEAKKLVEAANIHTGGKPVCILQGGETTVQVTGTGKGGRNQQFVLCALDELIELKKQGRFNNITILSAGTDGTDGNTEAAGAVINHDTLSRVIRENANIDEHLENNDAWHFFKKYGGLVVTGPTQTNVMDIMIAIVK